MATVGFLDYSDFIAEIEAEVISQPCAPAGPVRVEAYFKSDVGQYGIEHFVFFVECAGETARGDVAVFRFVAGRCQAIPGQSDYGEKIKKRMDRARACAGALHALMEADGYDVRPGVIAQAEASKTTGNMPVFLTDSILSNGTE